MPNRIVDIKSVNGIRILKATNKARSRLVTLIKHGVMNIAGCGKNKLSALGSKKFIYGFIFTLEVCLKDILITGRRHKELVSVVNVILDVDTVTGTAQECECRKDIRPCDV